MIKKLSILWVVPLFFFIGCAVVEHEIEQNIYESTREQGTRNRDAGSFFVNHMGANIYKVTYTEKTKKFDAFYAREALKLESAKVTLKNGYTHFTNAGGGTTSRKDITMEKSVIKCYKGNVQEMPPAVFEAEKIIADSKSDK